MSKYLVKKWYGRAVLWCLDFLLVPLRERRVGVEPKKVLLCNGAHLGDVVIAAGVIERVRKKYPGAEIGFLVGSWSKVVLEGDERISYVHVCDHWKLNRASISLWKKWVRYLRSAREALKEIRAVGYDLAIDLYVYFPNSMPLVYRAGIGERVGYLSGGFGSLMTDGREFRRGVESLGVHLSRLVE